MKSICFTLIIFLAACSDRVTSNYSTYDDAKNDRLFIRGWLPEILPVSTINIQTSGDLDSSISKGFFDIPVTELPLFISKLSPISSQEYSYAQNNYEWKYMISHETGHITYHAGRILD